MKNILCLSLLALSSSLLAQNVAINATGAKPNSSAWLDVSDSGAATHKGFLYPRLTTAQMNAIAAPAEGLMVYNSTTNCLMIYSGGAWQVVYCACDAPPITPGTITQKITCSSSDATYSIASVVGASSYTWTVPPGDSIIAGQGTHSITVSFISSASGSVAVTAGNSCGTSSPSATSIYIDGTAVSSFTASLNPDFVNNSIYFNPLNTGASSYSWAFQKGNPSTSTAQNPSVTWTSAGTYTVSLTVSPYSGCSTTTTNTVTIVNSLPCPHGTQTFNASGNGSTGTIQSFTVPCSVTAITISAYGAEGGASGNGGNGAYVYGIFSVSPGNALNILVGQEGGDASYGSGGGGGSFVWNSSNTLLIAAGGGGGSGYASYITIGSGGSSTNTPTPGGGGAGSGAGGTGGNGGTGGALGGNTSNGGGGGGAGWLTNGTNGQNGTSTTGGGYGYAPVNGGDGGTMGSGGNGWSAAGGYGGGGGGGVYGGGGGGGYNGGGGGDGCSSGPSCGGGGGGGSYIINTATNTGGASGVQGGNGQVVISW